MHTLLFLTADYANVTSDGKLNIMGIFNQISASSFPVRHPAMYLIIKLAVDFGEEGIARSLTIKLRDADGKEIMGISGPIDSPKRHRGNNPEIQAILQLKDVVFPYPGAYQFILLVDKDFKADLHLDVIKIEPPQPENSAPDL